MENTGLPVPKCLQPRLRTRFTWPNIYTTPKRSNSLKITAVEYSIIDFNHLKMYESSFNT